MCVCVSVSVSMSQLAVKRSGRRAADDPSAFVHGPPAHEAVTDITMQHAAWFLLLASAVLVLLFYVLNKYSFYILVSGARTSAGDSN